MGVTSGQAILVQVSDDAPEGLHILGPETTQDPGFTHIVVAHPAPQQSGRFTCQFPRDWKEKHWLQPAEERNGLGHDPYQRIEMDYDLLQVRSFLTSKSTFIIPLRA